MSKAEFASARKDWLKQNAIANALQVRRAAVSHTRRHQNASRKHLKDKIAMLELEVTPVHVLSRTGQPASKAFLFAVETGPGGSKTLDLFGKSRIRLNSGDSRFLAALLTHSKQPECADSYASFCGLDVKTRSHKPAAIRLAKRPESPKAQR